MVNYNSIFSIKHEARNEEDKGREKEMTPEINILPTEKL